MEKKIFLIVLLFSATADSALIVVNSNSGGLGSSGFCTLRSAINAAENDTSSRGCSAGSGDDTIILPNDTTINFFEVNHYNVGGNALPSILSNITIEGNNSTLSRNESAPQMRFFRISQNFVTGRKGNLTIKNITLTNGFLDGSGGAVDNNSFLTLDHVKIINNTAIFQGGGVNCSSTNSICEIKNSLIINNYSNYGGGINVTNANLYIDSSLIQGNTANIINAASVGGGIYVEDGNYSIINSTITDNKSNRYAGIFISNSPGFIDSSTIVNNNPIGVTGTTSIKNSILSNNPGGNCRVNSVVTSNGYNHSDDGSCSFANTGDVINTPIELLPLTYSGLYTATYPITEEGPAIDTGDPNCPSTDQRGVLRPQDSNNDGIFACDKGAHEKIYRGIIFNNDFE